MSSCMISVKSINCYAHHCESKGINASEESPIKRIATQKKNEEINHLFFTGRLNSKLEIGNKRDTVDSSHYMNSIWFVHCLHWDSVKK